MIAYDREEIMFIRQAGQDLFLFNNCVCSEFRPKTPGFIGG